MTKPPNRSADATVSEKVDTSSKSKRGGRRPGSGRKAGVPNKTTAAAKEAFRLAFEGMGGVPALIKWAEDNATDFYKLYSKLIPIDVTSDGDKLTGVVVLPAVRE